MYERGKTKSTTLLTGHETIVFDTNNRMYVMTQERGLIEIHNISSKSTENNFLLDADATEVMSLGNGLPLGGKFSAKGELYIADAALGLTRATFPTNERPILELLASRVQTEDGAWSPILLADDVTIGPKTGIIYFTDGEQKNS